MQYRTGIYNDPSCAAFIDREFLYYILICTHWTVTSGSEWPAEVANGAASLNNTQQAVQCSVNVGGAIKVIKEEG